MPVIFNEPLSFLQRLAEYMEHTKLIHQANAASDSVERMKVALVSSRHHQTNMMWLQLNLDHECLEVLDCVKAVQILQKWKNT